jgi:hypothetical protein
MRTTLDIDDDVLMAAKERARREKKTAGQLISQLLREAMTRPAGADALQVRETEAHYGFRPFGSRGTVVSDELVNRLREEEGT